MPAIVNKFIKHSTKNGWSNKELSNSLVLNRIYNDSPEKMIITWYGDKPNVFEVKSTLNHPKFGKTTLTRNDIKIDDVFNLIRNPRYHTKTSRSKYDHNLYLDTREAVRKSFKNKAKPILRAPKKKKKRESTGERALFVRIWNKRPQKSEISGEPLKPIDHPLWINQFAHILAKGEGQYPHYRLLEENIMLMTPDEHFKQTNQIHKCKGDPKWDNFFLKMSILKERYMEDFPTRTKRIE